MPTYTPSAVELVDILLPADGENIDAADVNAPFQEVADGVVYATGLAEASASAITTRRDVFTASGTWTCPANVTRVTIAIRAGGGGGGGGNPGTAPITISASGGGGGGASVLRTVDVAVVPTTVYTVTVGAGGAGGAGGTSLAPTGPMLRSARSSRLPALAGGREVERRSPRTWRTRSHLAEAARGSSAVRSRR